MALVQLLDTTPVSLPRLSWPLNSVVQIPSLSSKMEDYTARDRTWLAGGMLGEEGGSEEEEK